MPVRVIFTILCLVVLSIVATEGVSPLALQQLVENDNVGTASVTPCQADAEDCNDSGTSNTTNYSDTSNTTNYSASSNTTNYSAYLNTTNNPCDDFYAYACSSLEDEDQSNQFNSVKWFLEELENFFGDKYPATMQINSYNQSFTDKVLIFYHSCQSGASFDLFEILKPSRSMEWPIIDDYNGKPKTNVDNFDMFEFLGRMSGYGFDNLLVGSFVSRESNGSLYIELDVPYVSEFNENQTIMMLYTIDEHNVKTTSDIRNYYKEIENTHGEWSAVLNEFRPSSGSEMFTYQQIKELHPKVTKFLDALLPYQIEDDDLIVLANIKFFEFLNTKEWQSEETRKYLNYFMALIQENVYSSHHENCAHRVYTHMNFAVNYMYRKSVYTTRLQKFIVDLKDKVVKALLELVDENHLQFSDEQVQAIKDKLADTYFSVGNVPDDADDHMLEEFYWNLPDMDINSYGKNYLQVLRHRLWETINCPSNMDCSRPYGYGTFSISAKNLVIISLSALIGVFHWNYDNIFPVSTIGSMVGGEYGHLIDAEALLNSKMYNFLFDEFAVPPNLQASRECTKRQFNTDYIRQMEDDLIGMRVAYRLYSKEYNVEPEITDIPWQQFIFINFSRCFCGLTDWSGDTSEQIVRINYVAMNMKEFADAFDCPVGSKMNPVDKCYLY